MFGFYTVTEVAKIFSFCIKNIITQSKGIQQAYKVFKKYFF